MTFPFIENFKTGIAGLDDDHQRLILLIDRIAILESSADASALMQSLADFKASLAAHFQVEEHALCAARYPELAAHTMHHGDTIQALERVMRDVEDGKRIEGGTGAYLFFELATVVLQRDMQFVNWLADQIPSATVPVLVS